MDGSLLSFNVVLLGKYPQTSCQTIFSEEKCELAQNYPLGHMHKIYHDHSQLSGHICQLSKMCKLKVSVLKYEL